MKLNEHWPSTKAMSVYYALSRSGLDMSLDGIRDFLKQDWDASVTRAYVQEGAEFLLKRGLALPNGDGLRLRERHPRTRRGRLVVRTNSDADLMLAPTRWDNAR